MMGVWFSLLLGAVTAIVIVRVQEWWNYGS